MYRLFIYRVDDRFIKKKFKVHNIFFYNKTHQGCQKEERALFLETGTRVLSYSSPPLDGCLFIRFNFYNQGQY